MTQPEVRFVVGTAGHIDHGKTALVRALTGIDCDRWEQEKARGITIDLGFAHLEAEGAQVGFVDVPGHERFLHNALAGLGGIKVMLLVVAADEGVKPQTREHLDICRLLEIPKALVALTKTDLVSPDLMELAALEVEELLEPTPFAGAEILPVSSVTGEGVDALVARLLALGKEAAGAASAEGTSRAEAGEELSRLPVDRAFVLPGVGVVVTGTLVRGRVAPGDTLEVLPPPPKAPTARVRAVQVHGATREAAEAGERASLQLSGIELEDLERGRQLVTPGAYRTTRSLLARFHLLEDAGPHGLSRLGNAFHPVRLHCFASEVVGKVRSVGEPLEPGDTGVVELRLAAPVVAVRGDRYVVRRLSPAATLGGGEILDPHFRRRRGEALAAAGRALDGDLSQALLFWVRETGEAAQETPDLAPRLGWPVVAVRRKLAELAQEGRLLQVTTPGGEATDRWLDPEAFRRVEDRARKALEEHYRRDRLSRGMPKAEAVQRILPGEAAALAPTYLAWLAARDVLSVAGDLVTEPGRGDQLTGEESALAKKVTTAFEAAGLAPPSPAELARRLGAKPKIFEGILRFLVERERLVRLPGGLVLAAAAVESLADELRATGWQRFAVPQFKDRFGLSRKWAIPLLEHLDSRGVTRRDGSERVVLPPL